MQCAKSINVFDSGKVDARQLEQVWHIAGRCYATLLSVKGIPLSTVSNWACRALGTFIWSLNLVSMTAMLLVFCNLAAILIVTLEIA